MSTILNLGVLDVPYADPKGKSGETTGDVAEILEAKYHVMEHFFEMHQDDIAKALEGSLSNALESVLMGAPATIDPFGEATNDIEKMFKVFLSQREIETLGYPGIPTEAAEKGVNHRLAHPYKKSNPRRPSFIDTGTYENHFKAWLDK